MEDKFDFDLAYKKISIELQRKELLQKRQIFPFAALSEWALII